MDITAKIITQFVKDLSFENPKGPSGFQSKDEKPAINAQVDVKATNQKDTSIYEVELNISVSAARVDEQVYIVDLAKELIAQAGLKFPDDISIVYSGLKPGEKLEEELWEGEKQIAKTENNRIYGVKIDA